MSFLLGSLASYSVESSSRSYSTGTRYYREPTPCELMFGTCLRESWAALRSIVGQSLLVLGILFVGNAVLKASKHGHLSYRDISLAALVGSLIIHGTFQLLLRICTNLLAPSWKFGIYTPSKGAVLLWMTYPTVNGSFCGLLGVLVLRSSNSSHAELLSKMNFLFVVEAAAIGGAILFAIMMIISCSFSWDCFNPLEYGFYIRRRTSAQSSQTQTQVPAVQSPQDAPNNKPSTPTKSESTDSTITVV